MEQYRPSGIAGGADGGIIVLMLGMGWPAVRNTEPLGEVKRFLAATWRAARRIRGTL